MEDLNPSQSFNIKKVLSLYTKQWKWFLLSVLVCIGVAYFFMRAILPEYKAVAKIMILDDAESETGRGAIQDLTIFSGNKEAEIEDEIEVIKSRGFLRDIVKKLNLNVQHYAQGRINEHDLYKKSPLKINFIESDSLIYKSSFSCYVNIVSPTEFDYSIEEDDIPIRMSFGEKIDTHFGGIILTPVEKRIKKYTNQLIRINISPLEEVAEFLTYIIDVYPSGESSKILNLVMKDPVEEKALDVINALIEGYNFATIDKKRKQAINTANFINDRVKSISSDLEGVDDSIVGYKSRNRITDISTTASQAFSSSVQNQQQIQELTTQISMLRYMDEMLGDNPYEGIPSNLGGADESINALALRYNELLAQRGSYLKSAGENNPVVLELDNTLAQIRSSLSQSINNTKQTLNIQLDALKNSSRRINSKLYSAPDQERTLRSIERTQSIKEALYIFLLEKREEATISISSVSPSVKVVESPFSMGSKKSPEPLVSYLGAVLLGMLIPFATIYVKDLTDTKIHNKEDLQQEISNITVLGEIPNFSKKANGLISKNDRSVLSESFRIIRTNFDYVRRGRNNKENDNVLFVTSTINGEGKSFVSLNLGLTLANTGKRVLLIGADIRNPQIFSAIKNKTNKEQSKIGLTEFLVDESIIIGEAINSYDLNNISIDIMLSGKVPPNPAELLMSERMKEVFDTVSKQYDYVIVDTAPSMLVTDTLLFSQYAGHTIYVTRAGYTEKRILNFAKELHNDKKLNGMMLVVNDVKQANFGYGAKYGYYGEPEKKGLFKWF
ncbi:polysaccharide biosynthesis tyrosine autokinase [Seonamhaeicola sp. ML3]|uniref:GumC family protein n=1 Tax=Seonamhaeicola sp. ML3 TaxID=2937786 RepID=UPI00200C816E|nr:polysaccharide biosynthesis tyrosine autokinase [Seonamhaeicola sp. ML3]